MKRHTPALGLRHGALLTLITSTAVTATGLWGSGLATRAEAVDLKGSVRAVGDAKAPADTAVRPAYWKEWNGFIEPKKPVADLAREVTIVLIGAQAMRDASNVSLKDGQLSPTTIVMQQGTSLRIRNDDDFTHQLYADGLKAFDPMETSSGQGRQVQIDQAGTFEVHDALAPHVHGTLHVLPKLSAVAMPQADGTFAFPDVAAGDYTLKVFRGATELSSATLSVEEGRELVIDPINIDLKAGK